jgi:hypothetical protein
MYYSTARSFKFQKGHQGGWEGQGKKIGLFHNKNPLVEYIENASHSLPASAGLK